jgi:hypothetical protein
MLARHLFHDGRTIPYDYASPVLKPVHPYYERRRRRKREVRVSTINIYRQSMTELERLRDEEPDDGRRRLPLTWGDCQDEEGPCPFVSCRHHLFLEVDEHTGSLKLNFPDLFDADGAPELDQMPATCALREADRGGVILERMGECMNLTRERARQLEAMALERMHRKLLALECTEFQPTPTVGIFENPFTDGVAD